MANPLGTWTLFIRETKRFLKVWMQTVASPVFSSLLYFAIFGVSLNKAVPVEGVTYLQFLVPGLIILGMINNAYQNPASSLIIMKYQISDSDESDHEQEEEIDMGQADSQDDASDMSSG